MPQSSTVVEARMFTDWVTSFWKLNFLSVGIFHSSAPCTSFTWMSPRLRAHSFECLIISLSCEMEMLHDNSYIQCTCAFAMLAKVGDPQIKQLYLLVAIPITNRSVDLFVLLKYSVHFKVSFKLISVCQPPSTRLEAFCWLILATSISTPSKVPCCK